MDSVGLYVKPKGRRYGQVPFLDESLQLEGLEDRGFPEALQRRTAPRSPGTSLLSGSGTADSR